MIERDGETEEMMKNRKLSYRGRMIEKREIKKKRKAREFKKRERDDG